MGTRADFYVCRGKNAEWIGSIAYDGSPCDVVTNVIKAKTEVNYRKALETFFSLRNDVSFPEDGWPWPWETSALSDYAYTFDNGQVHVSNYGRGWFDPVASNKAKNKLYNFPKNKDENDENFQKRLDAAWDRHHLEFECNNSKKPIFPNMKTKQAVTLGPRSGLLVLGR